MFLGCLLALVVGLARSGATCGETATNAYADAVRSAGDVPVVIGGRATEAELVEALGRIDLLLLQGGEDVAPARYGAKPSPRLGKVDPVRDEFEFRLLREAVRRELPIVGICRGVQAMNVFFGGTLWQDLPSERADTTVGHRSGKAGETATHAISVQPDTRLAAAVGTGELRVNSSHHQAVRGLAPGFRVTARAADGVVEAIESDWYPAAGVQFHPERLCAAGDPVGRGFFRNLRAFAGRRPTAPRAERPIGVFDSGIGGLSVLELLLTVDRVDNATGRPGADGKPDLAGEDFVYLGDQANMPYGRYDAAGKADFLRELVVRDAQFVLGGDRHPPAKIVVIACNTATAYGLDELRRRVRPHDATVIGVVNAGVEAALDAMADEKTPYAIAVMATPATISSGVYERTIRAELKARNCTVPVEVANRGGIGLAEAVENREPGMEDCARTNLVALVEGYRARGGKAPIRALILGCTHYPFVLDVFRSTLDALRKRPEYAGLLAEDLRFVDPAVYTAEACCRALRREKLLRPANAPRAPKRVQAFISVGKDGPLSDAVKYGRDCGCHDLGTRIVPLTADAVSREVADGIRKSFPACHRELGLGPYAAQVSPAESRALSCLAFAGRAAPDDELAAFRAELRTFYPDWGQGDRDVVKDARQPESFERIRADLAAYAKANPAYDALDMRRECYLSMRRHFVPILFGTSPFYFEAGVNGGWGGKRPARLVDEFCRKFYREQGLVPQSAFDRLSARQAQNLALSCGPFVDDMHHVPPMRTILKKGFGGVRDEVAAALAKCPADDPLGRKELETALVGLDTIHEIQLKFHEEAKRRLGGAVGARALPKPNDRAAGQSNTQTLKHSNNLRRIAEASARCPWEPPRTFFEGLNTLWFVREILGYVDGVRIFALGRPDAWLVDLYRREIAAGTLTEAEARSLVTKFLVTADCHYDGLKTLDSYNDHEAEIPLTLGGRDDSGRPVYNELTRMFLDAHLAADCVYPKLHVRVGTDSPKAYLEQLGAQLCKGHAVFTVFNDDRLCRQFRDEGFAPEDANNYIGCGCWNGYVDSMQDVDCANYVSLVKVLALTIHRDAKVERDCALVLDPIDDAKDFEELRETVYRNAMRFLRSLMSDYTRYGRSSAKVFPHPVYTMCMDGGIAARRDTTDGGLTGRQRPKEITLGFIGNVVDSLCAIDQVCFRDRACTVREFLDVVRANWQGEKGRKLRARAMDAPYWGDDSDRSTLLMAWFMRRFHRDVDGFATDMGGSYKLAIFTYREFLYWGLNTKATPDGRYDGDRLAQGFSPSEFRCKEGVTTVMNAIGRLPNECLYECNANLTFDAGAMTPELMGSILAVFAAKGSHLMQPNCNSVEQLLDAQRHPELHRDLIVRVCGFSARFVALSKRWQDEVIARHRLK